MSMDRTLQARFEKDPVLMAAAEWFFEVRSNEVPVERIAEWQEWLAQDPAHRQAFEKIESLWAMSDAVTMPPRWPADSEVASDRYTGQQTVSEWRQRRRGLNRRWALFGLAASVAVAAMVGSWLALHRPAIGVETAVGETRTLALPDGSTVEVSGRTTLEAKYVDSAREISLDEGEAFFQVAKDPGRPFVVRAGDTSVTAVGTAFNVRRTADGAVIAVAEGAVEVRASLGAPQVLRAGEQTNVRADGSAHVVAAVDASSVAGWRDGRLQYFNEPLSQVVADLARHSSRTLLIVDEAVADLRVTGVVFRNNIDGWLAGLEATMPVRVVRREDASVEITRGEEGERRHEAP